MKTHTDWLPLLVTVGGSNVKVMLEIWQQPEEDDSVQNTEEGDCFISHSSQHPFSIDQLNGGNLFTITEANVSYFTASLHEK